MSSNKFDNGVRPRSGLNSYEVERLPIAVIGGAAGGFKAYQEFCSALPGKTGIAFILFQHFEPKHESQLFEILAKETVVPMRAIRSGDKLAPDHIYVVPAGMLPSVVNDVFSLSPQDEAPERQLPINNLMRSLAQEKKDCTIGIILSGAGTDGTLGLASIRAEGGLTFAQEPGTAEYGAMPRSAIESGCVDFVLSPTEIARELLRLQSHPYLENGGDSSKSETPAPESASFHEADLATILEHLHKVTTVSFRDYKPGTLCRRALRRAAILRLNSLREYADYLTEHPEECGSLYDDLLISVTSFFRDAEVFDALRTQILPAIVKGIGNKGDIRIWVPGCSTGEEVYSLAILLQEVLGARVSDYRIQIFGTDLNEKAIRSARAGVYPEAIVSQLSLDRLKRFFVETDGGYRIDKSVRDMCVFARHNLVADPPFSQIHLVTCRNLLIYLQPVLQKRIIPLLHYALQANGFLVLGGSENVSGFPELFAPVDKQYKIYAKKAAASRPHFDFVQTYSSTVINQGSTGKVTDSSRTENEILAEADLLVLANHAPVGVVINAAMEIIQFRGRPAPFLEQAPGKPSLNVLKLARNGLSVELRTLIGRAKKQQRTVRKQGIPFDDQGQNRVLDVTVTPLGDKSSREQVFFLILFEEVRSGWIDDPGTTAGSAEKATPERLEVARLRRELAETQSALRAAVESEDSLKEEFQSANEEILSANEELQSTNEELETSKEELQSTNEELNTVNAELRQKNNDLQELSSDISNLLHSTRIPVVMLDRNLRIRRVTPMADRLLKFVPSDIGRQIADIRLNIDVPDLEMLVTSVLETLLPMEREVRDFGGRWHNLTILPYRTQDDKIDGVVLALQDIDTIRRANEQLKRSADFFRAVMDTVIEPLLVLDVDLRIIAANQPFLNAFRFTSEEIVGHPFYRLGSGAWDVPELRQQLGTVLSNGQIVRGFILEREFQHIGPRIMLVNAQMMASSPGADRAILIALEDITERRRAERDMARLAAIVESSDDAIVGKSLDGMIESWNRGAERIFGYTQDEAVGQPITILIPPDRLDEEPAILERIRQGDHVDHFESIRRSKDGSLIHVSLMISPIKNRQGKIVGASKIVRDITRSKLSEAALIRSEKLAASGRLAAILAHEINNPLQAIVNLIDILAQSPRLAEADHPYLKLATEELNRITHLTRQSLSFYRDSAQRGTVDFQKTIEDLLELYERRLSAKQITVEKQYRSSNIVIQSYPGDVRQVLTTLLVNAIDALGKSGMITIRVRNAYRWHDPAIAGVRISVSDNGVGIQKEHAHRIFEPFFTTKGVQGTGLGLWVANGIVSRLGGSISLRSRSDSGDSGTCFSIFLPTLKADLTLQ